MSDDFRDPGMRATLVRALRKRCPDRLKRDHRNCVDCDADAVLALGTQRVLEYLSQERVDAALVKIAREVTL